MNKLLKYLEDSPALSKSGIAEEIQKDGQGNMSKQNFAKHLKEPISASFSWRLARALCRYGLNIEEWQFTYHDDIDTFIIEKKIEIDENEEPQTVERWNEEKTNSWFEYIISVKRMMIDEPEELLQFLKN